MSSIEVRDGQVLINGKPEVVISGEVHYYRLKRDEWQDRLTKLKEAGLNAVAAYIPWLCHEEEEGIFDFGQERENLDVEAFIELCARNDLYFIARPGPFIMAEMKNEGIPYWVAERFPNLVPDSWDHKKATTKTLDYLAEYTDFHFTAEEKLQEEMEYPGIKEHKEEHAKLRKVVDELHQMLVEEEGPTPAFVEQVNRNVIDWLYRHIKGFDRSVAEYRFMRGNSAKL